MKTKMLYRPVGLYELKLIQDSAYTAFPPRLPEQPIFYPVLNFEYAEQIAKKWNTKDEKSGYMGVVTRFELPTEYISQFREEVVGSAIHRELWIPAGELDTFNQQIIGKIEVIAAYYGDHFEGERI
ncbi:MAG: hypothetical protein WBC91_11880 [Phototrophicaceae bacterium]